MKMDQQHSWVFLGLCLLARLTNTEDILSDNESTIIQTWGVERDVSIAIYLFGLSQWSLNCKASLRDIDDPNIFREHYLWLVADDSWSSNSAVAGLMIDMHSP